MPATAAGLVVIAILAAIGLSILAGRTAAL
ncbi:hypothetical protein CHELA40_11465 [Chelatococcus asaccharovorans]|nr:hypothetical protein CHELA40_11465 [Chelatococcus asaccharovorans]CAH1684713.1 hypothetical protein CHELA17_64137 [Chelatococcus asaccharovorans]